MAFTGNVYELVVQESNHFPRISWQTGCLSLDQYPDQRDPFGHQRTYSIWSSNFELIRLTNISNQQHFNILVINNLRVIGRWSACLYTRRLALDERQLIKRSCNWKVTSGVPSSLSLRNLHHSGNMPDGVQWANTNWAPTRRAWTRCSHRHKRSSQIEAIFSACFHCENGHSNLELENMLTVEGQLEVAVWICALGSCTRWKVRCTRCKPGAPYGD